MTAGGNCVPLIRGFAATNANGTPFMSEPVTVSLPPGYCESYRGHVPAWHTDDVEHFTVAYYFERIERASARFLADHGISSLDASVPRHRDFYVRYARELRVSSVFVIQTGIIEHKGATLHLGHRIVDLADGVVCTTVEHVLQGEVLETFSDTARIEWDGPKRSERATPAGAAWMRTGTDIVMPTDLDATGCFHLSGNIHRFSGSGGQLMTQFGWTADYEEEHHVGFSTFEFQLEVADPPKLGASLNVEACLARIGNSSVHVVHRIVDAGSGDVSATLHQLGVHLDKVARRPSAIPTHITTAAKASL